MRIDIIGKHLEVTDAIRQFAEQKASRLPKYYDGVQQITFRVEQSPHRKGFHCEIVCDVEKHDDFVAGTDHADLYACIDLAVDKIERQLTDFKERLKQSKRSAANHSPPPGGRA